MANFCSNCGKPLNDGVQFCSNCGLRVSESNMTSNLNPGSETIEESYSSSSKKKMSGLKIAGIIGVVLLAFVAVFIGGVVYLFGQLSSDLDTADFEGYYQGEMWVTELTMEGNDEMVELMETIKSIKMPMLVEILDDSTYDGVFILKDPETLENRKVFNFGGEYDQILGDAEFGENEVLYLDGIVELDSDPIVIDGNMDLTNNDQVHITVHYEIKRVDQLKPVDIAESDAALNEAMNAYFNEMLQHQMGNEMDMFNMDEIEDNSNAMIEDQTDPLIPDAPLPNADDSLVTGAWNLKIGDDEDHFIILGKGSATSSYNDITYEWDHPGYALLFLDEDAIPLPYEIQSNMLILDTVVYGSESEEGVGYIKTGNQIYRVAIRVETHGDVDTFDAEVSEIKTLPDYVEKSMTLHLEASIDSDEMLYGKMYIDFINGYIVDEVVSGRKIH